MGDVLRIYQSIELRLAVVYKFTKFLIKLTQTLDYIHFHTRGTWGGGRIKTVCTLSRPDFICIFFLREQKYIQIVEQGLNHVFGGGGGGGGMVTVMSLRR